MDVRLMAAFSLGEIGPSARVAVDDLIKISKERTPVLRLVAIVSLAKIRKNAKDPKANQKLLKDIALALGELPGGLAVLNPRREAALNEIMTRFIRAATDQLNGPDGILAKIQFHQQNDPSTIPALVRAVNIAANLNIELKYTVGLKNPYLADS
jgi:hypothetical protein